VLDLTKYPKTVTEWLQKYEVEVIDDYCLLYKGTDINYKTQRETKWEIGKTTIALDWENRTDIECGYGLHFCHHPICCEKFLEVKHYMACKVQISDIKIYNGKPTYPDKIRARAGTPIYECDRWGKKLLNRDSKGRFCK
jgi:hypothetical protein